MLTILELADEDLPFHLDPTGWPVLKARLAAVFATKTRDEWAAIFAPLDACVAPVLTLSEAPVHPHNAARAAFTKVGDAVLAAPAPRFAATPGETGPLTEIGADSAAVLAELGFTGGELEELRDAGAIA
jgi:alpha-methylacyl-CoA racemase